MEEVGDNGSLKRVLMENGDIFFHAIPQTYKRKKVSVVRDFPLGCGRTAASLNSGAAGASVDTGETYGGQKITGDALEVDAKTHGNEADCLPRENKHDFSAAAADNVSVNEIDFQLKENVGEALEVGATNLKESGIDFQSKEENCDALENSRENNLRNVVDTETAEVLSSSMLMHSSPNNMESDAGKAIILYENNEGEELVKAGCLDVGFPLALNISSDKPEVLGDSCQMEFLDSNKSMNGLESKDLLEGDVPSEGMVPGSLKSCSPPACPIYATNLSDIVTKNYPPRRRISVLRDFPPLCGPNAPQLSSSAVENSGKGKSDLGKFSFVGTSAEVKQSTDLQTVGGVRAETNMEGTWDLTMPTRPRSTDKLSDQEEMNKKNSKSCKQGILNKVSHGGTSEGKVGKKVKFHTEEKSFKGISRVPGKRNQLQIKYPTISKLSSDKVIVQGLMAAPFCPWRQGKGAIKHNSSDKGGSQAKQLCLTEEENTTANSKMKRIRLELSRKKSTVNKLSANRKVVPRDFNQLVVKDVKDFSDNEDRLQDHRMVERSHNSEVNLLPFGVSMSGGSGSSQDAAVTRIKVRETLRLFQAICRKLLKEEEAKPGKKKGVKRIDLEAGKILKVKGKTVNADKKIVGHIPGVEVGDEFHYRMELCIVGVHRHIQAGIDFMKQGGKHIATSIVASGGYPDDLENSDTLIYSGHGGNVTGGDRDKQPEDQKLERGNLALKNSIFEKNPVRVIRGFRESKAAESSDARSKIVTTYTYDGLYLVHKYWQEMGQHGKLVFQFQLHRIPGQPELAWKEVKKSSKFKGREGLCAADISQGKELMPICAVNTLNDERPPKFTYINSMMYPNWFNPTPPMGCDCVGGCSDSTRCSCAVKNGGEIPYNHNGAIVEAKSLVYECGPTCRCPPSCYNRVTQHGIKFQLEVFKTGSRGWGVRSLNSIPSGSFICEYIGELLEDKEAEKRTGNDEYLFDIGHNYNDQSLWNGLSNLMPDAQSGAYEGVEDGGFTIDAAKFGNVGRFINHSCSPNLYAQNVLYDYEDKRLPHIMLFAAENIPPLHELSYHYNYTIDEVRDPDGNIKKKSCYCGSSECTGRMY